MHRYPTPGLECSGVLGVREVFPSSSSRAGCIGITQERPNVLSWNYGVFPAEQRQMCPNIFLQTGRPLGTSCTHEQVSTLYCA